MSDDEYPELEKTLIEISEPVEDTSNDIDILPIIIDVDDKGEEIDIDHSVTHIFKKIRERLISVIRRKFRED